MILRLGLKDIVTTAPPGGSTEYKLSSYWEVRHGFSFSFTGSGFDIHIKALGVSACICTLSVAVRERTRVGLNSQRSGAQRVPPVWAI